MAVRFPWLLPKPSDGRRCACPPTGTCVGFDGSATSAGQENNGQTGLGYGVYARLYDRYAQPQASEFQVNVTTVKDQRYSSVSMDAVEMLRGIQEKYVDMRARGGIELDHATPECLCAFQCPLGGTQHLLGIVQTRKEAIEKARRRLRADRRLGKDLEAVHRSPRPQFRQVLPRDGSHPRSDR